MGAPPTPALRRAVRGYLDHLTVERGLSANTLASYRRDLDRYLATLAEAGVTDLASVGAGLVESHLARLRAGDDVHPPLAVSSAARAASAVRGLHRFALREGLAGADPSRDVRPPTPPRRLPRALPVDDVVRLLETAAPITATGDDAPLALRDRALLEFLYGTGARISEAVGAAVDDLDTDEGTVLLRGKGGRVRLVPIGGYAVDAVRAYLVRARPGLAAAGRGTPAVFLNARAARCPARAPGASCAAPPTGPGCPSTGPPPSPRTPCATRTPPTCSTAAPTSGWSRNCSATRR